MSKFIRFINQSIKHFFIIDGEYLGDGCNEFKNGLPDFFTDSQFVTVFGSLSVSPWRCVSLVFCGTHSFQNGWKPLSRESERKLPSSEMLFSSSI